MSMSTIIFNQGTNNNAQVIPSSFPAQINLYFSGGDAKAYYAVDGKKPTIPLDIGTTNVVVNQNSLQLSYSCNTGNSKIQWELQ